MVGCSDLDRLLVAYTDGLTTADDAAALGQHLAACPDCRGRAYAEAAARQVVRARGAALVELAPPGLRTRCAALAAEEPRASWWAHSRWVSIPAAAALLLALAVVVFYGAASRSSTLVAAQLTLDHLKCFGLFEAASGPPDAVRLERRLLEDYGFTVHVPGSAAAGHLDLVGARRCFYHDGRVAHVMYRFGGRPVSLFMLPHAARVPGDVFVLGHEARIWTVGSTTWVVVMRGTREELDRVASYLRSNAL